MAGHAIPDLSSNLRNLDAARARPGLMTAAIMIVFGLILTAFIGAVDPSTAGKSGEGDGHGAVAPTEAGHGEAGHASSDHSSPGQGAATHEPAGHGAAGHGGHGYISVEHSWLHSYLMAFCFCASLSLGALFFVILHHLSRAGWSVVVRRVAECMALNIVVVAVMAIPLLLPHNVEQLYAWALPSAATDELISAKGSYLKYGAFLFRAVLFFSVWSGLAVFFYRESTAQDSTGDLKHTHRMQKVAPLAMLAFAISITLFAVDFLMSLDAHWFSTMFGVYYFGGSFMAAMAFLAIVLYFLQRNGFLTTAVTKEHYQDVGKLCFAFMVFWTYAAFSQYMLIWYANIPEETGWYLLRQDSDGWMAFSLLFFAGHFFVPFFYLLSRHVKRSKGALAIGAGWILLMHFADMYYLVMPQVRSDVSPNPRDLGLLLALLGVFLFTLIFWLRRASLVPERDPRLVESLAFENV